MKKILSAVLAFLFVFNISVFATGKDDILSHYDDVSAVDENYTVIYTDLADFAWALPGITYLTQKNIVAGYEDLTFRPREPIANKEYIKLLVGAAGIIDATATSNYLDINEDDWSYLYVSSAFSAGILGVFDDRYLGGSGPVTRENIAYMTAKALEVIGLGRHPSSAVKKFLDDDDIAESIKNDVYFLRDIGILNGDDLGNFNPKSSCTRAESSKIIYTLVKYIEKNI